MKFNMLIKRFKSNNCINYSLFHNFKPYLFIKYGNRSHGFLNATLKLFLSFTLVVFIPGVVTHIVQAEPKEEIQPSIITKLRSTSGKSFSKASVKDMLERHNFFCKEYHWSKGYSNPKGSGFHNKFEEQKDGLVIYDNASGLTWQQSGSSKCMDSDKAKAYVDQLNHNQFAGYNNWRLPTLEEAMSLMEPTENNDRLYIDSVFDKTQAWILTSDQYNSSIPWNVDFSSGCYYYSDDSDLNYYVRAVR